MENKVKGTYGVRGSPETCGYSVVMYWHYCTDNRYSAQNKRQTSKKQPPVTKVMVAFLIFNR